MISMKLLNQLTRSPRNSLIFQPFFYMSFDCQNCSKKTVLPECTACHRMVNYFKIFDIPESYQVNPQTIALKAKQLQKQYHPDKHSFKLQVQSLANMQNLNNYSAYINDAKATLLDDLKRAVYMMQIRGVNIEEQTQINDSAFMLDMFELQEQIQNSEINNCKEIKTRIEGIMKELQCEFDNFFKAKDMNKCKQFVQKYKYLHRAYQNAIKKIET